MSEWFKYIYESFWKYNNESATNVQNVLKY